MGEGPKHIQRTLYFPDGEVMGRFFDWCEERGVAPGSAVQTLVEAFIQDLEFQRHQLDVTLPVREVRFK